MTYPRVVSDRVFGDQGQINHNISVTTQNIISYICNGSVHQFDSFTFSLLLLLLGGEISFGTRNTGLITESKKWTINVGEMDCQFPIKGLQFCWSLENVILVDCHLS